jgi:hypothetical protein
MTTHPLVSAFYGRVWNAGERAALDDLVTDDFRFQGSLGAAVIGRDAFWAWSASCAAHCQTTTAPSSTA